MLNVLINVTQSADELIDQWPVDPVWTDLRWPPSLLACRNTATWERITTTCGQNW